MHFMKKNLLLCLLAFILSANFTLLQANDSESKINLYDLRQELAYEVQNILRNTNPTIILYALNLLFYANDLGSLERKIEATQIPAYVVPLGVEIIWILEAIRNTLEDQVHNVHERINTLRNILCDINNDNGSTNDAIHPLVGNASPNRPETSQDDLDSSNDA